MEDLRQLSDFVKRLSSAIRVHALYPQAHPLARRSLRALQDAFDQQFARHASFSMGFIGHDVVVGSLRMKASVGFGGIVRHFHDREVEKLTFSKSLGRIGLQTVIGLLSDRDLRPFAARLADANVTGVTVGALSLDEPAPTSISVTAARHVFDVAMEAADSCWTRAQSGDVPDPNAASLIIDSLANAMSQDRASMLAITALKGHDAYTFSHMVNVSLLTMAQARALGIHGPLLREFGLAGFMHDIGKVKTPLEILNKPDRLTREETRIMQRHVVDGAQILRRTPEIPPLIPIVAFEHHLKHDLTGYPARTVSRPLNLCTMLVSIADAFDALRTKRIYRDALPAARVRKMLGEQSGTAFEPTLLRRFISLVGIFPVGTCVRLKTGEVGVVTDEHATDPFRPTVTLVLGQDGSRFEHERLVDTAEHDVHGRHRYSVLEAVDPEQVGIDPFSPMHA
jgi:putative nucleotidyltransferase with HDIG domain